MPAAGGRRVGGGETPVPVREAAPSSGVHLAWSASGDSVIWSLGNRIHRRSAESIVVADDDAPTWESTMVQPWPVERPACRRFWLNDTPPPLPGRAAREWARAATIIATSAGRIAMHVNDAVRIAKDYVADIFSEEQIEGVGLEEVTFDEGVPAWKVTIGFFRPWNKPGAVSGALNLDTWRRRSFKVVRIDDTNGRVLSLTHRSLKTLD